MSLEEIRMQNKEKVVEAAIECFVQKGIVDTKISEIAKRAGVTDRSVYRYFKTKAEIVLATALLFWQKIVIQSEIAYKRGEFENFSAKQQIGLILNTYAEHFFTDKDKIIFILEAEAYLYRSKMLKLISNKPPASFESGTAPLCKAINKGLADGTIKSREKAKILYYNAYDSLLGLMQKMAISAYDAPSHTVDERARLTEFCDMLVNQFCE